MAFAIAIRKNMKNSFSANQMIPNGAQLSGHTSIGDVQPPRNRIVASAHIVVIATYSPSMNSRYGVEPYSTMKPATSSDSASTRSNGGRLVSASAETQNTTNIGNSGQTYQYGMGSCAKPIRPPKPRVFWASTTDERFSEPAHNSTVMMTKPIETS